MHLDHRSTTAPVAAVLSTATVTAVLPQSPIASTHIDDVEDDTNSDVNEVPLSVLHLVWNGSLLGPEVDFPVPMLLDDSSHN